MAAVSSEINLTSIYDQPQQFFSKESFFQFIELYGKGLRIKEITCNGIQLHKQDCDILANFIKSQKDLKILNLSGGNIGDSNLKIIFDAISLIKPYKLERLNISYNMLTDNAMKQLINFVGEGIFVRDINLQGNEITDMGVDRLTEQLKLLNAFKLLSSLPNSYINLAENPTEKYTKNLNLGGVHLHFFPPKYSEKLTKTILSDQHRI